MLALIVERARELLGTDVSWLALVEDARVQVQLAAGATTPEFPRMEVALGTGIGGIALHEGRTVVVGDQALYGNGMPASVHRALEAEGVVSVICAPMFHRDEMVGALYVGSRTATDFDDTAVALLTALAGQAAIAIVNSRLYQALADKNRMLERSFAVHRRLSAASLSGAGPDAIAEELGREIGREVQFAREGDGVPILAGGERLGALRVGGDGPLSQLERNALEHAATVIALQLRTEQAALEAEWRVRGELLEEILQAGEPWPEALVVRAQRLGVALGAERCIAVLEGTHAQEHARAALGPDALLCRRGDGVIVALDGDAERALRPILAAAGGALVAGVSSRRRDAAAALREAQAALRLARHSGGLVGHAQLGPLRFLLDATDTAQSETLVRELLGPLAEHDARRDGALLETLRAYLRAGGHHATAAAACHIHPSTLKYRLARIDEVLGRGVREPETGFELTLALAVHEMLLTRGIDALA